MALSARDIEEELRQMMMGTGDQPDLALDVGAEKARLAELGAGMTEGMGEDLPRGTKVNFAPELEVKAPESAAARMPIVPKVVDLTEQPKDDMELAMARAEDRAARKREAFERGSRELVGGLTRTQAAPTFKQPQDAEAKLLGLRERKSQDAQRNESNRLASAKFNFDAREAARKAALDEKRDARDFGFRQTEADENQELRKQGIDASNRMAGAMMSFRRDESEDRKSQHATGNLAELRKEFNALPEVKDFKMSDTSLAQMKSSAAAGTPQGDISLIFTFMKTLDPTSAVREGEYATAANSGGVPDSVRNAFNKLIDGERLTPEQRTAFVKQAEQLHSARRAKYDAATTRYRSLAEKQGAAPDDVTGASAQAPAAGGFVTLVDENGEELDVSPDKVDAILKKHSNLRRK